MVGRECVGPEGTHAVCLKATSQQIEMDLDMSAFNDRKGCRMLLSIKSHPITSTSSIRQLKYAVQLFGYENLTIDAPKTPLTQKYIFYYLSEFDGTISFYDQSTEL